MTEFAVVNVNLRRFFMVFKKILLTLRQLLLNQQYDER